MNYLFSPIGLLSLFILIYSAILHEIAHGYMAERLGDPTARLFGRLTLDPRPHIDLWMTILLPLLLIMSGSPIVFGGAKPVPVDEFNLRDGRRDMALVALAGPLTNALLAILAAIVLHISQFTYLPFLRVVLEIILRTNIMLAIFNLLPIPPLDGSKIFSLILPTNEARIYQSIGRNGTFLLFALLLFSPLESFIVTLYSYALRLLGF